MYPNWNFWYANILSGNPVCRQQNVLHFGSHRSLENPALDLWTKEASIRQEYQAMISRLSNGLTLPINIYTVGCQATVKIVITQGAQFGRIFALWAIVYLGCPGDVVLWSSSPPTEQKIVGSNLARV
jgi:hypothetical protein